MPFFKDTGTYKANVRGIPYIQVAINDNWVRFDRRVGACQGGLTAPHGTEHHREHNKDLDQTFGFHVHFLLQRLFFVEQNHSQVVFDFFALHLWHRLCSPDLHSWMCWSGIFSFSIGWENSICFIVCLRHCPLRCIKVAGVLQNDCRIIK